MSKKKNKYPGGYVVLENIQVLQSKAWKKLNGSAVKVYLLFRLQEKVFIEAVGKKEIKISYSTLVKETGLSLQTIRNSIIQLENLGFLDQLEQGGLKSGGYSMNTYRLSRRFCKYGTSLFEEGDLKKTHNTGRGFELMHQKKKKQKPIIKSRAVAF